MLWNNTNGTRRNPAPGGLYYPGLTEEEAALAYSFPLGITTAYTLLSQEMAPVYGKTNGGFWIYAVSDGSLAQKLGIAAGDLLIAVNGIALAEDIRAIELGKIKMAQGESVEFAWLRGDELMLGAITKD